LVVDGDRDTAQLLRLLLERRGFVVRVAHSVAMALSTAEEAPIDLLVSDIRLPDGNGCDLVGQLRSKIPLLSIAISGSDQDAEIRRCLNAGFQAFLAKPVASSLLFTTIQQLRGG
jgi:CheY-like chemotaxis protein